MIDVSSLLEANPRAKVTGPPPEDSYRRFCFDSRLVEPGDLFVAVRTARGDGHDFVGDAVRRGAVAQLVESCDPSHSSEVTAFVVADTVSAMEAYGSHVIRKWGPRVVAVTGTVGKTSTKEMIADVLAEKFSVFRTPGNFGGRYGLAISLGGLEPGHEVAVVEMSTGHFGEMAAMCKIAPPEIGVVTIVDAAHLLALDDVDGVAREKSALIGALPHGGLAILNADDPRVLAMSGLSKAPVVTFGTSQVATYRASNVKVEADGTSFDADLAGWTGRVELRLLGAHVARSVLAAAAVAAHLGIEPDQAIARVRSMSPLPGRLNPLPGAKGSLILDDTYNAAPVSVMSGLETLRLIPASQRIAVLGDMAELGRAGEELHRQVGRSAATVVDLLVTVGNSAAWAADQARRAGLAQEQVVITYSNDDASEQVSRRLTPGTVVLVKGSASSRSETVVEKLLADPSTAGDVLVRRGPGWAVPRNSNPERPTWLEIDLGAVAHNVSRLAEKAGSSKLMAVLKADAYGHGAVQVAHTALLHGASACGVACVPEARILREAGVSSPIIVLGHTPGWQARQAVSLGLTLSIFDTATAAEFSKAAQALDRQVLLHVKVDTGMHRLGVPYTEAAEFTRTVSRLPGVSVSGIFTHFAMADDLGEAAVAATDLQKSCFDEVLADLAQTGDRPELAHAANSAALLARDDVTYDMVRPGIAIYGLPPDPSFDVTSLRAVLSWKSQIAQMHDLQPGECVGYGHTWRATRRSLVAVVPVGYADGFRRGPTTWEYVLVRGQRVPVVGRVSMDQMTVDVTGVQSARRGDEVVLIGSQGGEELPATTVAGWLGTSCYEVVAEILARVPRVN